MKTRNYVIKSTDFKNITPVEKVENQDWLETVKSVEKSVKDKIVKVMNKASNLALLIGKSGKYYIVAKPSYQPSLKDWLEKVGIEQENIVILKKSTETETLSLEQVKKLLVD